MLDGEASKLYETFSSLKNQQKGFLSNLVNKVKFYFRNQFMMLIPRVI